MLGEGSLKEFKSFAKDSWKGFGGNGSNNLKQLQAYIKSGKPFEYVANKTKLINDGVTDPLTFVKQQFQRVFKEDNYALFDDIWNGSMKNRLWDDIPQNITPQILGKYQNKFKLMVDDVNSDFYKFINVE